MYYCQDANMYEKVTSVISWNCPRYEGVAAIDVVTPCVIRTYIPDCKHLVPAASWHDQDSLIIMMFICCQQSYNNCIAHSSYSSRHNIYVTYP